MALPGTYEIRLIAHGETRTARLNLLMDPRVAADGVTMADLKAQQDIIREVSALAADADALGTRLRDELGGAEAPSGALRELECKVFTERGIRYPTPMLLDQVRYLASMVDGADQKPGRDAFNRLRQLRRQVEEIGDALDRLQ